ncbi:MAG: PLP-dependent aminotransferase family protein [Mesosutterella sp.]|nr:PLP-dependent aminotransferase family protein [Mesosutterella sp.]
MTARTSSLTLDIELDTGEGAVPLKDQVYQALLAGIRSGSLRPGDRLPSSRALSARLGVGRVTVTAAYARLRDEGWLAPRAGGGSVVTLPPGDRAAAPLSVAVPAVQKRVSPRASLALEALSFRVQALRPFAIASPDYESLPGKKWTQIVARVSKSPWLHNGYCEPCGYPPFREAIANYVRRARGLNCAPEDVIVTSGIQQGLSMCAQVLFEPGEKILVEDPGYQPHRQALAYFGLRPEPVRIEEPGLDLEAVRSSGARGMLVTPCHQYPMGYLMGQKDRSGLIGWAASSGAWLIEDDYDGELRFDGAPHSALASADAARSSVVYLGSFTKMIYPGFNMGYLIAPKGLAAAFGGAKMLNDRHASEVHQVILAEFIAGGRYEAHVRRLKKLYKARRAAMIEAAQILLGRYGRIVSGPQGTHLAFQFSIPVDDRKLAQFLRSACGLELRTLSECCIARRDLSGLILGFAGFTEEQIREGMHLMAKGIERFLSGQGEGR